MNHGEIKTYGSVDDMIDPALVPGRITEQRQVPTPRAIHIVRILLRDLALPECLDDPLFRVDAPL